eukprot:m.662153 g.662153  ORF g.662153 m.662153 type:complete len:202 (-) comp22738_c0_seq22:2844-3449(-)
MAASLAQNLAGCVAGGNTDTSCVARYLCTANGTGVAPVYILFNAVVSAALVWLPYEALIEFAMLQFTVCSFCLVYAYTWYKVVRPDMHRPLSVPGGLAGGIFVSVPVVAIGMVNLYFGCVDEEEVFGVPYAKAVGLAFFTIAGALVHVTHRLVFRCMYALHACCRNPLLAQMHHHHHGAVSRIAALVVEFLVRHAAPDVSQ